ncbi:amidohydrolase family protein [Actinocatenispora rupis]|uniref:Amidohydrolase n=1 Tax=Actinocatenispora rupis TaxID=519421 RepID=A0A8J3N9J9_9ACTN|nr:amidohydrolase family protein [Actinocatenispora rupis]GID11181.1 amidohydrolase [Actinocatenispora rupis]
MRVTEPLALFDHHCHGVVRRDLDRAGFEALLTEGGAAGRWGGSRFDTRVGLAVRRWCAPVLDLPPDVPAGEYLARRAELGYAEVTRRFLGAAVLSGLCVDTGYEPEPLTSPAELGAAAGAPAYRIGRLETIAEGVLAGTSAAGFAAGVADRIAAVAPDVVGWKSIAAYRGGLALPGARPGAAEVTAAADRCLRGTGRIADPVLHAYLVWTAVDTGLPVQFHTGFGDADLDLARADPLLLTDLLRALAPAGVPVLLLHTYPYHRQAGYLALAYDPVFVDVGLAGHGAAGRTAEILAEVTELAPLTKLLYSSDAYALAEHHHLAALLYRDALAAVLDGLPDAERLAGLVADGTARRVYLP